MPNNFTELDLLLQKASESQRHELAQLIGIGSPHPKLICDQLCFLRSGVVGQAFDRRDYKQLVTDIADVTHMDWSQLVAKKSWENLSSEEIEDALVQHLSSKRPEIKASQHIPFADSVADGLAKILAESHKHMKHVHSLLRSVLKHTLSLQSTQWPTLAVAVVYINQSIRKNA